jgi:hypothetical protein
MNAVNRTAVYCLLNVALVRTGLVIDLGDTIIVQTEHLGDYACTKTAPYADILIDIHLTCHLILLL